jgi:hypothetical protein
MQPWPDAKANVHSYVWIYDVLLLRAVSSGPYDSIGSVCVCDRCYRQTDPDRQASPTNRTPVNRKGHQADDDDKTGCGREEKGYQSNPT